MDNLSNVLLEIKEVQELLSSTKNVHKLCDIKIFIFQNIMNYFRRLDRFEKNYVLKHEKEISELNNTILSTLSDVELPLDCQLLASKAFCAGNFFLYEASTAMKNCIGVLKVKKQNLDGNELVANCNHNVFNICVCLALLELNSKLWYSCDIDSILLDRIYPLCEIVAYKYSSVTLVAFKCFVKIFELLFIFNESSYILPDKFVLRTMNIIVSNWENPLNGVREQNCILFNNFVKLTNEKQWFDCVCIDKVNFSSELFNSDPLLYLVLNQQSWMTKSKYFLLSGILKNRNTHKALQMCKDELLIGLKISLQYTYLAPAGGSLYDVCISRINFEVWKEIFLPTIIEVLESDGNRLMKENLISYWIQTTLNNHKGAFYLMYNAVKNLQLNNLYSFILLFQVGRKEGSISLGENNEKLKLSLLHSDEDIRSSAFLSLCVSKIKNSVPSGEEICSIKQFLIENINYDSMRLRQNIIHSCSLLLIRFRDSFLFKLKGKNSQIYELICDENLKIVMDFIVWLHEFLIDNLEDGCNYQRKYTSLLIYETVLNYLDKGNENLCQRKSNTRNSAFKFKEYAEKMNKWNFTSDKSRNILFSCVLDPSEPVRKTASDILSNYFYFTENDLINNEILNLYKTGIDLCSDRYFYQSEAGAKLIETIIILVYKNINENFKNNSQDINNPSNNNILEEFLNGRQTVLGELLNFAEEQKTELFKDILKAASNGSPLHGILNAIKELLTNPKNPEFGSLESESIEKLLVLMESVVKKLVDALAPDSNISDFAPSFADMGQAIENIAQKSAIYCEFENDNDDNEEVHLSSAHQLILNCIWLNIKTCCAFAGKLITSTLLDSKEEDVKRCVELIVYVLQRCRHKGAIEMAGSSMMQVTKYLTTNKNLNFQAIPGKTLKEIFEIIMASEGGTVSRRSAGLSILVHKIIAGDSRPKKPLLHTSMVELIGIASKNEIENYNELTDSSQTRALHFIAKLVQDSTLRQEVAHHIQDISVLCFNHLSSNIWPIRNAALQLFGSLVPKLIGQKKHQDCADGMENYSIPIEELYFHVKNLFQLIEDQFNAVVFTGDIVGHSQLMPSLSLLSNLTVTMHSCINEELKNIVNKFNLFMEKLFSSCIYHVRKLSAVISSNFCLPFEINDLIKTRIKQITIEVKNTYHCNNQLHGLLLNLKFLLAKFYKLKESILYLQNFEESILSSLKDIFDLIKCDSIPSFVKTLVSDVLFYNHEINTDNHSIGFVKKIEKNKQSSNIIDVQSMTIGFPTWCYSEMCLIFFNSNLDEINTYIKLFLNLNAHENVNVSCLKCLKLRLISVENFNLIFLKNIFNTLIDFIIERKEINVLLIAFDVLLLVINRLKIFNFIKDEYLKKIEVIFNKYLKDCGKFGVKCSSFALPVVCCFISGSKHLLKDVISLIWKWSHPDESNEDLRLMSVESLYQMVPFLKTEIYDDEVGLFVWKSVCNFLQDEDIDTRIEVTKFTTEFFSENFNCKLKFINPYVALNSMYQFTFMGKLMSSKCAIKVLWELLNVDNTNTLENEKLTKSLVNPFDHGLSNIYKEDVKIIDLVFNELLQLINDEKYWLYFDDNQIFNQDNSHDINDNYLANKKLRYKNELYTQLRSNNK